MNRTKTALLTGGTDGIGKAIALNLAKQNYSVHIVGRNETRGNAVLTELIKLNPNGNHQLFLLDLAEVDECLAFVNDYKQTYSTLDLLVLNANIAPKKPTVNAQGLDSLFMIGYISRYLLTATLEPLLQRTSQPSIIHVNSLTPNYTKRFDFAKLTHPKYSILKSINQCYIASTHMVLNNYSLGYSKIPTMLFDPGVVLTRQVLDRGYLFTSFSKLFNAKKPEWIGAIAVEQIKHFITSDEKVRIAYRTTVKKPKVVSEVEKQNYKELINFSTSLTNINYTPSF